MQWNISVITLLLEVCLFTYYKNKWHIRLPTVWTTVVCFFFRLGTLCYNGEQLASVETDADKFPTVPYLNGVIVGLAGFCIRLVWHEPSLQEVLVKTVPKSSNWSVVCEEKRGQNMDRVTDEEKEEKLDIFLTLLYSPENILHQSISLFFSPPLHRQHILFSHFPVLFTPSLMCTHFSVPSLPAGNVCTAFAAVPICRTPHRDDGT